MKFEQFENLVWFLDKENLERDEWVNTVPREINSVFFDNPYVESQYNVIEFLLENLLSDYRLKEVLDWFLYEVNRDKGSLVKVDDEEFLIRTVDDFLVHMKRFYDFD